MSDKIAKHKDIRRALAAGCIISLLILCLSSPCAVEGRTRGAKKTQAAGNVQTAGWNGKTLEEYAGGDGSPENPYQIANAKQLAYLSKMVNAGEPYEDAYFILTDDIDLNKKNWVPIGTAMTEFQGHLNGNDHTVSNLYIRSAKKAKGLFAYTLHAEIEKVRLAGAMITGSEQVGALIGVAADTTVKGCSAGGTVKGTKYVGGLIGLVKGSKEDALIQINVNKAKVLGDSYVGGIAGNADTAITNSNNYGDIYGDLYAGGIAGLGYAKGCVNHGTVGGMQDTGGIVGKTTDNRTVSGCLNFGTVGGSIETGGIVGYAAGSHVLQQCANYGTVSGTERVGGIAGVGSFTISFNTGTVSGDNSVGGLIGYAYQSAGTLGYNRGNVSGGKNSKHIGGIVGYMQTKSESNVLADCYSVGRISGKTNVGGIVGYNGGTVTNTFYMVDGAACGIGKGNKGTARPKEDKSMKKTAFLTLLNKETVSWKQKDGQYPTLKEEKHASSSNLTTAKTVDAVENFAGEVTGTKVVFTWDAPMRVTGCQIYQYNAEIKKYEKIKTLPSLKPSANGRFTCTYTRKGLAKHTAYKFRIRAYKTLSGKNYYGKYTTIKIETE